jgi:hypothetical protein
MNFFENLFGKQIAVSYVCRGLLIKQGFKGAKVERVYVNIRAWSKAPDFDAGLPDLSWCNIPKREKYTK